MSLWCLGWSRRPDSSTRKPVERPAQALERAQAAAVDVVLLAASLFGGRLLRKPPRARSHGRPSAELAVPRAPTSASSPSSTPSTSPAPPGQTLGKIVFGLRVVDTAGRPPGYLLRRRARGAGSGRRGPGRPRPRARALRSGAARLPRPGAPHASDPGLSPGLALDPTPLPRLRERPLGCGDPRRRARGAPTRARGPPPGPGSSRRPPRRRVRDRGRARRVAVARGGARASPDLYLLGRGEGAGSRSFAGGEAAAAGRTRQALLLLRKHVNGTRIRSLRAHSRRARGRRRDGRRPSRPAPLRVRAGARPSSSRGRPCATLGEGPPAWPVPAPAPERDWDADRRGGPGATPGAKLPEGSPVRAILSVAPAPGPAPGPRARRFAGVGRRPARAPARRAAHPDRPRGPIAEWTDALLADGTVMLLPMAPRRGRGHGPSPGLVDVARPPSSCARGSAVVVSRRAPAPPRRGPPERAAAPPSSLAHLEDDLRGMAEPVALRRQAEALARGAGSDRRTSATRSRFRTRTRRARPSPFASTRDCPYRPECRSPLRQGEAHRTRAPSRWKGVSPRREPRWRRLAAPRRSSGSRKTRAASRRPAPPKTARPRKRSAGPRRYLTSRGLTLLVGRGARENHHLTFAVARPEDLWLHARDVPGAHVIVRDDEGRAAADDLREAAEVAAFFSEAKGEARVDVHVTRRKHVRAGDRAARAACTSATRTRCASSRAIPRAAFDDASRAMMPANHETRCRARRRLEPRTWWRGSSPPASARGYSPFAPGTAGSAVGLLLFWPSRWLDAAWPRSPSCVALFFVGVVAATARRAQRRPRRPGHRRRGRGGGHVDLAPRPALHPASRRCWASSSSASWTS